MEKILSQDEVDALLRGLVDGDVQNTKDKSDDPDGVRPYDLTSQDRIVRGRMPTLEIINDRFARFQRVTLSVALRRIIEINALQPEMIKFGEFIRALPLPTSLHILKMAPLRGYSLFMIESRLLFNLVDYFFGGSGKRAFKIEGRDYTSIETRMIFRIVDSALKDLERAWNPVSSITFQLDHSEVNPQFAEIVTPTDIVIVMTFEVEVDRPLGRMALCVPYSVIEPIRSKLYATYKSDTLEVNMEWVNRLRRRIHEVSVGVSVELGRTIMKGSEVLRMEKGDVIILDQTTDLPLNVLVQGVPKFKAVPGIFQGNRALQISNDIDSARESD